MAYVMGANAVETETGTSVVPQTAIDKAMAYFAAAPIEKVQLAATGVDPEEPNKRLPTAIVEVARAELGRRGGVPAKPSQGVSPFHVLLVVASGVAVGRLLRGKK